MSTEFENQSPQVEQTEEQSMELVEPKLAPQMVTMWNNTRLFNQTYKMAKIICQSELVPQNYRGKEADVLIAIDIGNRIGISPILVMQQSQIVKGIFTWKGSACKSMVDGVENIETRTLRWLEKEEQTVGDITCRLKKETAELLTELQLQLQWQNQKVGFTAQNGEICLNLC